MATNNELFVVYVNPGTPTKTLSAVRVKSDNCVPISDRREVIMIKHRRPDGSGGWFTDEVSGWPCFSIARYVGKAGQANDGVTVTKCRPKDGPSPAEGIDLHFDDDDSNGIQKTWPAGINQASIGSPGPRLLGYDTEASDFQDLLDDARALNPDDTTLTV